MEQNTVINGYIDVDLIQPEDIKVSEKTGKRYLYLDAQPRKEPTEHGENVNFSISRSKEERIAGVPRRYIGNGRSRVFEDKKENPLEAKTQPVTAKEVPAWTK